MTARRHFLADIDGIRQECQKHGPKKPGLLASPEKLG
jgi:hypothetical protein